VTEKSKLGRPVDPASGFRVLAGKLLEEINAGKLAVGSLLPPLRVLQKRFGVGYRTVWMAVESLKNQGRLAAAPGRRLSILPEVEGSASVLNPVLEVVSYSKLGPVLENPLGLGLHLGVSVGVDDINAPLLTLHGFSLRKNLPQGLGGLSPRGILLLGHFDSKVLRDYEKLGLPVVLIDLPVASWRGHSLCVDNAGAMQQIVARLKELGHQRIAFVQRVSLRQKELDHDASERAKHLLTVLKKAGLPGGREAIFTMTYSDGHDNPFIQRLLKSRPGYTAIITSDPSQAMLLINKIQSTGRSVPEDVSVLSFKASGDPGAVDLSGPSIDFEKMGRKAVELLKYNMTTPRQERFPVTWFPGKTLGAVKS
jgi:Periplasmic binding protein-like domain/Bacterial regulatory proteins, gntR family